MQYFPHLTTEELLESLAGTDTIKTPFLEVLKLQTISDLRGRGLTDDEINLKLEQKKEAQLKKVFDFIDRRLKRAG
jgi:hypothetical protein